ncbi:MAG: hypothetical protein ACXVX9_00195 [Mycobacteriaceae bacterium]
MADPDEALIEAIAEAVSHAASYRADDPGEREVYVEGYDLPIALAAYTAMVEHLGLVEETDAERPCGCPAGRPSLMCCTDQTVTVRRRLVSRWTEVDHGSE